MTVNREWVRQVEDVIAQVAPRTRETPAPDYSPRGPSHGIAFRALGPVLVQTPRARAVRELNRIATWYGWGAEIERALDAEHVPTMDMLSDQGLMALKRRMRQLEDCVQFGASPPDSPPA